MAAFGAQMSRFAAAKAGTLKIRLHFEPMPTPQSFQTKSYPNSPKSKPGNRVASVNTTAPEIPFVSSMRAQRFNNTRLNMQE
jgi:hypothetical protein